MINLERRGGDFTCENMMLHDASAFFAIRAVTLTVTFLSITCKINQEQYLARFTKVQVWQCMAKKSKIQSCFDLRLCDFGQPCIFE
jgi:hypothetical protein